MLELDMTHSSDKIRKYSGPVLVYLTVKKQWRSDLA